MILYSKEKLETLTHTELIEYIENLHNILETIQELTKNEACKICSKGEDAELHKCRDCKQLVCKDCGLGYTQGSSYGVENFWWCSLCIQNRKK